MEKEEASSSSNRPSIGFPLGLALLLIFLFCMSTILSCWLKWHELSALIRSSSEEGDDGVQIDISTVPVVAAVGPRHVKKAIHEGGGQSRLVVMPGDRIPRFIAIACPCEPPMVERLTVKLQKPSTCSAVPVPLYL